MTKNPSQLLDRDDTETPALVYGEGFDRLKALVRQQVEDAEANHAYAERQYHRAQKELKTAKESYARICAGDVNEVFKRGQNR